MEKRRSSVYHNGKFVYSLNEKLAERQGVTDQEMINLVDLHQEKLSIFSQMEAISDRAELRRMAGLVEGIEFEMQKNWHFPQDATFHEWYNVPNCTCPKMDNEDRRGTSYRVVDAKCPIHGEPSLTYSPN